ncbi:MAG: ATP-binding cassette domain-containing protein [Peptostreptococcaceae bacterium]|jgi:macrolide transport system ATP-binding/permease protein|nr:ATP-binding cassette domain-containing protein [Peptostreptococcaceae bacterium]
MLIELKNIIKEYDEKLILDKLNLNIKANEKIGLIGDNGCGKTTLVDIICGKEDFKGYLKYHKKNLKINYLKQDNLMDDDSLNEYLRNMNKEEFKIFLNDLKLLNVDNIKDIEDKRINNLSEGEKLKISLAYIFTQKSDIIILDEPTNHMDLKGISWLIEKVNNYYNTLIIISHDRYFLDQTTNKIIEILNKNIDIYDGNYTRYKEQKDLKIKTHYNAYKIQENYKQEINKEIKRLKSWSDKGHRDSTKKEGFKEKYRVRAKKKDKQIKSKIKKLQKIDLQGVSKPIEEAKVTFDFISDIKTGKTILEAKDIKKSYDERVIFKESSFYIKSKEKVLLFGLNGCGKTTLIKSILKKLKLDEGSIYINPNLKIGYLSQTLSNLDDERTLFSYFDNMNNEKRGKFQILLNNMGIKNDMINHKIKSLSFGEKTRFKIALMIIEENNLLILDEPTNHLDIKSRYMLEQTLKDYSGSLIIVSHDRYFAKAVCDKVLLFENKKIKRVEYSFEEFVAKEEINKAYEKENINKIKDEVDNSKNKNKLKKQKNKENKTSKADKLKKEQLLVIENEITNILSKLSIVDSTHKDYDILDKKFKDALEKKTKLLKYN